MNDAVGTIDEFRSLPKGWTVCTLLDLVVTSGVMSDGDWVETKDQDPNGEVRLIQLADIGDGVYLNRSGRFLTAKKASTLGCTFLAQNDLLIARMADPVGRVCIFPGDTKRCVTAVDVCIFRPGHPSVDHRWLMHIVNSPAIRNRMESLGKGVTRKRISGANLKQVQIPLAPVREQQRTADKIDELFSELDAGVASLERARVLLKKYRHAVLKAAVTGELTRDWRERHEGQIEESGAELLQRILKARREAWEAAELNKLRAKGKPPKDDGWKQRYKEPQPPDTTDLPELPEGWAWASIEQLAAPERNSITDGPFGSNLKTAHYTDAGPRVLRLENVGEAKFIDIKTHIAPSHFSKLSKHQIFPSDIVIASLGQPVPRACLVPADLGPAIVKADCIRFKPDQDLAHVRFVMYALNSECVHKAAKRLTHGVGRPRLNLTDIRALAVPLPPLGEQFVIADAIDEAMTLSEREDYETQRLLSQASVLKQAILKAAFAGKLVSQDPNDEPASVLLERIRAERSTRPKPVRGRRGGRRNRNGHQLDLVLDRDDAA